MCGSFHHINLNYNCIISSPSCGLFNPLTYSTVGVITTSFFPQKIKHQQLTFSVAVRLSLKRVFRHVERLSSVRKFR